MIAERTILTLPKLYPKQYAAIYAPERYSIIEASTKSGKTAGCIVWLLGLAWSEGKPGHNYWWVAPIYPQAKIAYSRMRRMLLRMDPHKQHWSSNESELWLELVSGAKIWFKGADNADSLYGEDVYAAVIDEGTRVKETAWHAVRSTLTFTRGPIRIIGNVKGRKNWVYRMARQAEAGEPNMAYARITCDDAVAAGVLHPSEIDDARRRLPEMVFRELYLAEAGDDAGNPFGLEAIRSCIVYDWRPRGSEVACWGVDLAKSQDWTVAIGLDAGGQVAAWQRWQADWHSTESRLIAMIGGKRALVDMTGVGDPIVEGLQRRCGGVEGFRFSATSKQQLMQGLAVSIQNRRVSYPPGVIVDELESFEYEVKVSPEGHVRGVVYTAPPGCYDDCVCALGLAERCRQAAPSPRLAVLGDDGYGREQRDHGWLDVENDAIWS